MRRVQRSGWRLALGAVLPWAGLLLPAECLPADRLILRNLDILTDRTVTAFDEDGLVLDRLRDSGHKITWDEVERGRVALDQPRFDALLAELGSPLYRIRQRLKIGDYEAAGELAEALYERFKERRSQTAYLVCQATMWSRVAQGQRELAVEPYLRSFELLRSRSADGSNLPGARRLRTEAATAISPELLPVWFDTSAAKAALEGVQQAIRSLPQPRPAGVYVYYATLAIAAGESGEAERVLPLIIPEEGNPPAWREIVLAQQELAAQAPGAAVERLRTALNALQGECRPAALYIVGLSLIQSPGDERQHEGLLALLTLPAAYGREQPELAAAGLYHAAQSLAKLKDTAGATAVRRELAHHYARTYFGARLREDTNPKR